MRTTTAVETLLVRVVFREDEELVWTGFGEAGADGAGLRFVALAVRHEARADGGDDGQVARQHAELTLHARRRHFVDGRREGLPFGVTISRSILFSAMGEGLARQARITSSTT